MKILDEDPIDDYFENIGKKLLKEIEQEGDFLCDVSEKELIDRYISKYTIIELIIDYDNIHLKIEDFPGQLPEGSSFKIEERLKSKYSRKKATIYIPISGNLDILNYSPRGFEEYKSEIKYSKEDNSLVFKLNFPNDDEKEMNRELEKHLFPIKKNQHIVNDCIKSYNRRLPNLIKFILNTRKNELQKRKTILTALGVKLYETDFVPDSFKTPIELKSIHTKLIQKSDKNLHNYHLEDSSYQDILKIICDVGIAMERNPSIYKGKNEEPIRDLFLMVLLSHYPGTTSETFNNSGKTDILIRQENHNIFIAECKFWKGPEEHKKTIDQILNNLTWQDSKAAIIVFNNNLKFNNVLSKINESSNNHSCLKKDYGNLDNNWFKYKFHLKSDKSCLVDLNILCFNFNK